jgi:lipopolysaccharide export system permease protein
MRTISRYVLRRTFAHFAFALLVVLLALSLERLLRIVQTITDQGAPLGEALRILGYLIPHYLGLAVPAALFLAVLLAIRQLQASSELAAILNAGVPVRRLLRPVVGLALVLAVFMLVNAGYLQPHARYAYRATMHEVTEATLAFRLQPGTFQRINDRPVVRADDVERGGRVLHRFFAEIEARSGARTIITAREARVVHRPATRTLAIRLRDGTIVREALGPSPETVRFEEYTWQPPVDAVGAYGPRGHEERELTLGELAVSTAGDLPPEATRTEVLAELHARLVKVASLPVLAALAVPLALLGGGRTGRAYGLVIAVALLVLYEKVLGFAQAFAADGAVPAWLALWLPFAVLLALAWALLRHASEAGGRSLTAWLAGRRPAGRPATGMAAE